MTLLCERQGLEYHTVARALYRFQHPEQDGPIRSLDFDMADKLLCGVHLYDLWYTRLNEYYKAVDLSWATCACPGCSNTFPLPEMQPALCVMDDCGDTAKARGLCNAHHIAARKNGTLDQYPNYYSGRTPLYCSEACRQAAHHQTTGVTSNRRKNYLQDREKRCRNNHPRTPENTFFRKNGKRECLICKRSANNAGYHRRNEQLRQAA